VSSGSPMEPTMAEIPSRTWQRDPTSEAPTPNKRQRLERDGLLMGDSQEEMKERAQRAATEWLLHEGDADRLSLGDLALTRKHSAYSTQSVRGMGGCRAQSAQSFRAQRADLHSEQRHHRHSGQQHRAAQRSLFASFLCCTRNKPHTFSLLSLIGWQAAGVAKRR
jgi:hypothetical protein